MSTLFLVSYVLLWILVVVLTIGVIALYHHMGNIYLASPETRANAGPDVGSLIRATQARATDGTQVLVPPPSKPTVLLFVSTTCSICVRLRPAVVALVRDNPDVAVTVFCQGRPAQVSAWAAELAGVAPVVADVRGRYTARYDVDLLPFAVAVGLDATVRARSIVNDEAGLRQFAAALDPAAPESSLASDRVPERT